VQQRRLREWRLSDDGKKVREQRGMSAAAAGFTH